MTGMGIRPGTGMVTGTEVEVVTGVKAGGVTGAAVEKDRGSRSGDRSKGRVL